jgi:hypothetical protein
MVVLFCHIIDATKIHAEVIDLDISPSEHLQTGKGTHPPLIIYQSFYWRFQASLIRHRFSGIASLASSRTAQNETKPGP